MAVTEAPAVLRESFAIVKNAVLVAGFSCSAPITAFSSIDLQRKRENHLTYQATEHRQKVAPIQLQAPRIKELIVQIRELWSFNVTELAEILSVSRPTVYNWMKEKTPVDSASFQHLQSLKVTGEYWKSLGNAAQDYLLDYAGPDANETTIRASLKDSKLDPELVKELSSNRIEQYHKAREQFESIVRNPLPLATKEMPEEARALTEAFAEMAHAHSYSSKA